MLTFQLIPYSEISGLNSEAKIKKILNIVKENKIVLMQGKLKPSEETTLIQRTMEDVTREFSGIELCTVYPAEKRNRELWAILKALMVKYIIGDREGLTIIGPASVVKEIKKDPNRIELFMHSKKKKKR